jgi:endonuclease/exonuclease/phosphatase family metal-dependent hydrolase
MKINNIFTIYMEDFSNKVELLNRNIQVFLKEKYNVTFYDTLSDDSEKNKDKVVNNDEFKNNPIIKRIDKMYMGSLLRDHDVPLYDYAPFKKYEHKEDEIHFSTINFGKIVKEKHVTLNIKKGDSIYKGTRDFVTLPADNKFVENSDPIQPYWFGSNMIGYQYSKTYQAGLNAYKFKYDSKLFIVNDTRNEKVLIDAINNLTEDAIKKIGHSKKDILDSARVKYGYDCNIGYQIKYIERYTGYPDLWIARYIDKQFYYPEIFKYRNKRIFGAGKLDRVFGRFMCYFCNMNDYIGYCSLYNYSIFYALGLLGDEMVICDQNKNIERDINDELDWYQWKKYVDIDFDSDIFKNYLFNPIFHTKKYIGVFKQYYNNQLDNKRNDDILKYIKKTKPKFKFITLNVHNFVSSNLNDTFEITINKLKELLDKFDIDFCFLEEYTSYVKDEYVENIFNEYNILKTPNLGDRKDKFFGNVLLSKDKIKKFEIIQLSQKKHERRMAIIFEIDNKNVKDIKFCGTHLEIGERYTERSGAFKKEEQIIDIYNNNANKRILELNKIMNNKPDIIMGDFNFTKEDPEFEHISTSYKDTLKEEYPTLFNNERVDFIISKKNIKCESFVVSYPYSDHLPIIGLLY